MSDYDLLLRMHLNGVDFKGVNETIIIFQRGGISSNFFNCLIESYKVRVNNKIFLPVNIFYTSRTFIYKFIYNLIFFIGLNKILNLLIKIRRRHDL